jgi:hypothetical protein
MSVVSELAQSVRHMPPAEYAIVTGIALVLALAAFIAMFRFVHRSRLIKDTPTSLIRSAHQGYVELEGTAELLRGEPIRAALTGSICTWYTFKVDEYRRGSRGGGRWHTIRSGNSKALFLLRDGTGECVIDPDGALVTPSSKTVWYGNSRDWTPGTPVPSGRSLLGGRYRYTEQRIVPSDHLYALGLFRSEGGGHHLPDVREEVRVLLNQWKQDQPGLLERFDANRDGRIDQQEWEGVRRAAEAEVRRQMREQQSGPVIHIMSKPRHGRRPYLLSTLPQDALSVRYRWYAKGSLAGFLLAGVAGTWLLSVRFVF